jgi:hypothetical protein
MKTVRQLLFVSCIAMNAINLHACQSHAKKQQAQNLRSLEAIKKDPQILKNLGITPLGDEDILAYITEKRANRCAIKRDARQEKNSNKDNAFNRKAKYKEIAECCATERIKRNIAQQNNPRMELNKRSIAQQNKPEATEKSPSYWSQFFQAIESFLNNDTN